MLDTETFIELRDRTIAKHSLNMASRSLDKAWLARYIWPRREWRHKHADNKHWTVWLAPPENPVVRSIRFHTLEELYALPTWLIRASIEAYGKWCYMQDHNQKSDTPEKPSWHCQGRLVGEHNHLGYGPG